jgi:hypothetical protein
MRQLWWQPRRDVAEDGQVIHESHADVSPDDRVSDAKSWEEIGMEFRLMLYDILHRFRQEIKRKE